LGRRPAPEPQNAGPDADATKLKSVILEDFDSEYPESVKEELSGAGACIWTIALTPGKAQTTPWEQTVKICRDYAVRGIETIAKLPRDGEGKQPLRFMYISGHAAERDPNKKPWILGDYCLMRGEVESHILDSAKQSDGAVEAAVAKPGLIAPPGKLVPLLRSAVMSLIGLPKLKVGEIAAALLHQVVNGFEKDTLLNEDMVRIARGISGAQKYGAVGR
ncbi:protein FMP52, mitochondrial, partial [Parachaetomium inaequale]